MKKEIITISNVSELNLEQANKGVITEIHLGHLYVRIYIDYCGYTNVFYFNEWIGHHFDDGIPSCCQSPSNCKSVKTAQIQIKKFFNKNSWANNK